MADSREIVLAGKSYKLTLPLTLGQLIDCNVGLDTKVEGKTAAAVSFERALHVLAAAMKPDHPECTVEFLRGLRGATMAELNEATTVAYEESGLIPKKAKDQAPGEAQAAA